MFFFCVPRPSKSVSFFLINSIFFFLLLFQNAEQKFNFGATPFRFAVAAGFRGVAEAATEDSSCGVGNNAPLDEEGRKKRVLAVIVEPSVELAQQTHDELGKFSVFLPEPKVQLGLLMGGQPQAAQVNLLRRGVDVVTATPGRLIDLIQSKALDCSDVRFLVLDEADKLMQSGNFKMIEQVRVTMFSFFFLFSKKARFTMRLTRVTCKF